MVGAALLQAVQFTTVSWDMMAHLLPWMAHIRAEGPIGAFAEPFANYAPPYLYLLSAFSLLPIPDWVAIKLLSSLGVSLVALSSYQLLRASQAERPIEGAAWLMVAPTVAVNAGIMSQADALWVAPCLMAVASAQRGRMLQLCAWSGLAFAVKAQAAFFAPFVVATLLTHKAPWRYWLLPALIYLAAITPAWLAGWPASDLLTIYLRQAQWVPEAAPDFLGNAANWVAPLQYAFPKVLSSIPAWPATVLGALMAFALVAAFGRERLAPRQMPAVAALSAILIPFILPLMHERFMILGDVLTLCYAWTVRTRRSVAVAALMQFGSFAAIYDYYWVQTSAVATAGSVAVLAAIVLLIQELRERKVTAV